MKTNQILEPTTPEWDHVRSNRDRMRGHARNRPAGWVFFGQSAFELKEKYGIAGRGGDRRSKMRVASLKTEAANWKAICNKELQMNQTTVDRGITKYLIAMECAEALDDPSILRILRKPSVEVTEEDFETVAANVDGLVDRMTQANLRIELGITLEEDNDEEYQERGGGEDELNVPLEQQALAFFASIPRKIEKLKKDILGLGDFASYQIFLSKLPLEDERTGKPSLLGIKEGLEAILCFGLSDILKDVEKAAKAKMHGEPVKTSHSKTITKSRKTVKTSRGKPATKSRK
jgi:hypothetical protein